ncbi:MAG: BON domain-containing protein, partial [Deltaproteobacteria bacterium]|nr:BON domain-containing protein [Deltaproteobacteria bacterium]
MKLIPSLVLVVLATVAAPASAQDSAPDAAPAAAAETIAVDPKSRDHEIEARLENILAATKWFQKLDVRVQEGVVFLEGASDTNEHATWAADLARRTQDVAAVVNRLEFEPPSVFDFEPATAGLRDLGRSIVGALPLVVFAFVVLGIGWLLSRLSAGLTRRALARRTIAPLLREVIARIAG